MYVHVYAGGASMCMYTHTHTHTHTHTNKHPPPRNTCQYATTHRWGRTWLHHTQHPAVHVKIQGWAPLLTCQLPPQWVNVHFVVAIVAASAGTKCLVQSITILPLHFLVPPLRFTAYHPCHRLTLVRAQLWYQPREGGGVFWCIFWGTNCTVELCSIKRGCCGCCCGVSGGGGGGWVSTSQGGLSGGERGLCFKGGFSCGVYTMCVVAYCVTHNVCCEFVCS